MQPPLWGSKPQNFESLYMQLCFSIEKVIEKQKVTYSVVHLVVWKEVELFVIMGKSRWKSSAATSIEIQGQESIAI